MFDQVVGAPREKVHRCPLLRLSLKYEPGFLGYTYVCTRMLTGFRLHVPKSAALCSMTIPICMGVINWVDCLNPVAFLVCCQQIGVVPSRLVVLCAFEHCGGGVIVCQTGAFQEFWCSFLGPPQKTQRGPANVSRRKLCEQWYGRAPKIIVTDAGAAAWKGQCPFLCLVKNKNIHQQRPQTVED